MLIKRFPYSNLYTAENGRFRGVFGGVPNVPVNKHGKLEPLDNRIVVSSDAAVRYKIVRGPVSIGFHRNSTNKYLVGLKARTGEKLVKTLMNDVASTPTISDERYIQWDYPGGSWIREYVTEKEVKEVMKQKAGQAVKFRYDLSGLTPKIKNKSVVLYRDNGKVAGTIQRPHYINAAGEFQGYFDITWQKVSDHYELSYPIPASDKLIDPSLVFGEGVGQTGGDHKDTQIASAALSNRSWATNSPVTVADFANRPFLGRFSLAGHIPRDAIVRTSTLTLTIDTLAGAVFTSIYQMYTAWGVSSTDEGISAVPAANGQATYDNAFDYNGPEDVGWAAGAGVGISAADYNPVAENTNTIIGGAGIVAYNWQIPIMTQAWVRNDSTNYGYLVCAVLNNQKNYYCQEDATVGRRPYLTVEYDVLAGQSKISNSVSVGIGR